MKDLVEVRLTVATRQLDGRAFKAMKPLIKKIEPYFERLAETVVSSLEDEKELHKKKREELFGANKQTREEEVQEDV
jgi:hypothetical protein